MPATTPTPEAGLRLECIPLSLIDTGNPRTINDAEADAALGANIRENGVLQPPTVVPITGTGRYQTVGGSRRIAAHAANGDDSALVLVHDDPLPADELLIRQVAENTARAPLHPWDLLQAVGTLVKAGWTCTKLAKRLGESESTVSRWITVVQHASAETMERIKSGRLSLSTAYTLCRMPEAEQSSVLAGAQPAERLTRDQAVEAVKRTRGKARGSIATRGKPDRITARLQRGAALTLTGRGLTIDKVIQSLGELLALANRAQADGLSLMQFAWLVRTELAARRTTEPQG